MTARSFTHSPSLKADYTTYTSCFPSSSFSLFTNRDVRLKRCNFLAFECWQKLPTAFFPNDGVNAISFSFISLSWDSNLQINCVSSVFDIICLCLRALMSAHLIMFVWDTCFHFYVQGLLSCRRERKKCGFSEQIQSKYLSSLPKQKNKIKYPEWLFLHQWVYDWTAYDCFTFAAFRKHRQHLSYRFESTNWTSMHGRDGFIWSQLATLIMLN